jgi:hypothetical protein
MQAITGAASVFAIFVQSTGDVCRRQARLRVAVNHKCEHFRSIGDLGDPFWKP